MVSIARMMLCIYLQVLRYESISNNKPVVTLCINVIVYLIALNSAWSLLCILFIYGYNFLLSAAVFNRPYCAIPESCVSALSCHVQ